MNISNIFKKQAEEKQKLPPGIKPEGEESAEDRVGLDEREGKTASSVSVSSALNRELEKISNAVSSQLYTDIVAKAKHVYSEDLPKALNCVPEINPLIEKAVDVLQANSSDLVLACLKDYPNADDLLYYHVANTTIASIAMGVEIGYDRPRLVELGVAAFVHDIGTRHVEEIRSRDIFSNADLERMRRHPDAGAEMLSKVDPALSQRIIDAVRQEHERADGSGYPKGLQSDEINEYAQIIGLADVYEAMMHDRPYRHKYTSLETIRIILKNKRIFSRKVAKALINTFGIFPIDTLVQLNTKEIGVVIQANEGLISRPVINILIDSYGKELKEPKRIDLADNPVVYIDTCVRTQVATATA